MDLTRHMTTFGSYLKQRWGEKVHKLSVSGNFTCPNRDGSKGIGGCTFCNNASFSPAAMKVNPVSDQLQEGGDVVRRRLGTHKYLAYFQAYTNTYGDIEYLRQLYDQALESPGVIGMSVGTRPDCVPDPVLDLLARYRDQGHEVWLELGLQSSFDDSLQRVNRGHGFAEYVDAVKRAQSRDLNICTHLIVGLPGEAPEASLVSLDRVLDLGTTGLKFHPLHVVKGTQLARQWKRGEYEAMSQDAYVEVAVQMIERVPRSVVMHRLTGTASDDLLLAPDWCKKKWPVLNEICRRLDERSLQNQELQGITRAFRGSDQQIIALG